MMVSSKFCVDSAAFVDSVPVFLNDRVLQALQIQISILDVRSRPRTSEELEPLFIKVESLLRDLVRETGAA